MSKSTHCTSCADIFYRISQWESSQSDEPDNGGPVSVYTNIHSSPRFAVTLVVGSRNNDCVQNLKEHKEKSAGRSPGRLPYLTLLFRPLEVQFLLINAAWKILEDIITTQVSRPMHTGNRWSHANVVTQIGNITSMAQAQLETSGEFTTDRFWKRIQTKNRIIRSILEDTKTAETVAEHVYDCHNEFRRNPCITSQGLSDSARHLLESIQQRRKTVEKYDGLKSIMLQVDARNKAALENCKAQITGLENDLSAMRLENYEPKAELDAQSSEPPVLDHEYQPTNGTFVSRYASHQT